MTYATEYLILDLETTGLDPYRGRGIIEVGALAVDFNGEVYSVGASFAEVVRPAPHVMWDGAALAMHRTSGLRDLVEAGPALPEVEDRLLRFVAEHFGDSPMLAGNSIHFDRLFLAAEMPRLYQQINHRGLDISGAKRWLATVTDFEPVEVEPGHRALDDCHASLDLLNQITQYVQR